jgi:phosphatidylserine/phosphatidylglycerophosphate/cardiolipin synthase-like enzyme
MTMRKAFEAQYEDEDADRIMRERVDIQSQAQDLDWAYQAMSAWLYGKLAPDESTESPAGPRSGWAKDLRAMKHLEGSLARPLPRYLSAETRILDSTTRLEPRIDPISEAAVRLVKSAREEIFIQNPYVVALREAIDIFSAASGQGVPIVLLTNSPASSDSMVTQAFFLEQWPYLLASIPTLRLYGNGADQKLHAKLASFDKVLSLVGTYNLSPLSMAINSEVVVAVWSSEFAEKLTENPRARLASGAPKTYRYRIVRNEDGTPKRDEDGKPMVEFGPEDHTDVESMVRLRTYRNILKAADMLPGVSLFY